MQTPPEYVGEIKFDLQRALGREFRRSGTGSATRREQRLQQTLAAHQKSTDGRGISAFAEETRQKGGFCGGEKLEGRRLRWVFQI